jgi:hypothetical protein
MESNDIPMMEMHHEFCALLQGLLKAPWMDEDNWTVSDGPWMQAEKPQNGRAKSVHAGSPKLSGLHPPKGSGTAAQFLVALERPGSPSSAKLTWH